MSDPLVLPLYVVEVTAEDRGAPGRSMQETVTAGIPGSPGPTEVVFKAEAGSYRIEVAISPEDPPVSRRQRRAAQRTGVTA